MDVNMEPEVKEIDIVPKVKKAGTEPEAKKVNLNVIKNWTEDERPRERMTRKGAQALSDAELLAILIQCGTKDVSALEIAQQILRKVDQNLVALGKLSAEELQVIKGIGSAKATKLVAALELGRRRQMIRNVEKPKLASSKDAVSLLMPMMQDLAREHFCVLCLTANNTLLHREFASIGGLTSTTVDLKVIFKIALQYSATRIIVAHNHPSGNPKPSNSDRQITQKLQSGAKALDMQLVDHIIIADRLAFSFADEGLL